MITLIYVGNEPLNFDEIAFVVVDCLRNYQSCICVLTSM